MHDDLPIFSVEAVWNLEGRQGPFLTGRLSRGKVSAGDRLRFAERVIEVLGLELLWRPEVPDRFTRRVDAALVTTDDGGREFTIEHQHHN